jgi:molecular chaperone GrpE
MNDSAFTSEDSPAVEVAAPQAPPQTEPTVDHVAELAAMKKLADERLAELAYARAEIENVRKRAFKSAEERLSSGRRALLGKFISVLDNLERALAFDDSEGLRGGLQATLKQFEVALAAEGIVAIETVGKPFDPHVAEAIATRDSKDHEDEIVIEDVQRGYRLGDDLLRPAMVIVAKHVSD